MHKHHKREQSPAVRRRSLSTAIAFTLALGMAGSALAQEVAPAAAADGPAAADPAKKAQELDTVTVTANKREENIREVAVAITKISDQQLENINATQMTDYANYVPGLAIQSSGTPGQVQVSMRGIAALSPGSTVGTYVDETPVGSNSLYQQATLYQLDLLPYDVESIEVLRGPQGTLYGAGAMGGLIKYTMKKPDPTQAEYRIGGGYSSTDSANGWGNSYRLGANVPLKQDVLALRASYARNKIAGYIDNLYDGREDINNGDQTSARASLRWQGESADVTFTAMQQKIDSDNNATVALDPVSHGRIAGLSNYVAVDEVFKKDLDNYALTVNWDAGFADFVSATSYTDTHTLTRSDLTFSYGEFPLALAGLDPRLQAGKAWLDYTLDLTQFTQEFRLQSKSGQPFEWLVGAFYSDEDGKNHQLIPLTQFDGSPLPAPWDGLIGTLGELSIPTTYKETAVFANGAYKFNDWFKLGGGLRWSRNDQDFSQDVIYGSFIGLTPGHSPNTSSEDVVTWSITPQFQINENMMAYAKASTGYQPGGPNIVAPGLPSQVDSSTLTSYELGLKSAWMDNRVLFDLVGYQIDWKDIQVASRVNGISGLVNGGKATSRGLELSLQVRPTNALTLGFNGAYNDANIDEDFPTITVNPAGNIPGLGDIRVDVNTGLKGDRMPYVPDLTWSFTADYYYPVANGWGLDVGGGFRWVDDRTNATTNRQVISLVDPFVPLQTDITEPLVIGSYNVLDLYASFSNEHWSLRTYIKNATDEKAYSTMNDTTSAITGVTHHTSATPIQPRMFGFEVDYRF
ncbi:TonB-dependent receptor [Lysobacter sp. KIS68-7]|uniref:TonB-dependent receptor n=1 Tax=Lysobacter sp. KIS68-7 TaxID=2904252 RepID=UPI001E351190|nr:TonB-dependent receptor [Lysobacter sp. KIS68-7]UHQ20290.1 TonB-dependent receptor [Lysobacter sp. KIS68-7]